MHANKGNTKGPRQKNVSSQAYALRVARAMAARIQDGEHVDWEDYGPMESFGEHRQMILNEIDEILSRQDLAPF